jgi:hypothetical protein
MFDNVRIIANFAMFDHEGKVIKRIGWRLVRSNCVLALIESKPWP